MTGVYKILACWADDSHEMSSLSFFVKLKKKKFAIILNGALS